MRNIKKFISNNWPSALLVVLLAGVYISNISHLYTICIIDDEFGYWGNAATLAGFNWDFLLSRTAYYSMGYSLFLYPLYLMGLDAITMQIVAVLINMLFIFASYFCALYISKALFPTQNRIIRQLICVVSVIPCASLFNSILTWSEVCLTMQVWCLVALFVRLDKNYTLGTSLILTAVGAFIYLTHQRALFIFILVVAIIAMKAFQSKKILCGICVAVISGICVVGVRYVFHAQVDYIYGATEAANSINNIEISTSFLSGILKRTIDNIGLIAISFICKLGVLLLSTCFTLFISLKKYLSELCERDNMFLGTKTFIILSALMMYALSSIQMFGMYRKDLVVYSRYMDFVIQPLILFGFNELMENRMKYDRLYYCSVLMALPLIMLSTYRIILSTGWFSNHVSPIWNAVMKDGDYIAGGALLVEICLAVCVIYKYMQNTHLNKGKYIFIFAVIIINLLLFNKSNETTNLFRYNQYYVDGVSNAIDLLEKDYPETEIYGLLPEYVLFGLPDIPMKTLQYHLYDRPIKQLSGSMDKLDIPDGSIILTFGALKDARLIDNCEPVLIQKRLCIYTYNSVD